MTLWDYLHLHPWIAILHGFMLIFIILVSMQAAIGVIGVWFGTVRKVGELEEAYAELLKDGYDVQRMTASVGAVMMAINQHYGPHKSDPSEESDEEAEAS